jgi:hypothetical protein
VKEAYRHEVRGFHVLCRQRPASLIMLLAWHFPDGGEDTGVMELDVMCQVSASLCHS